MRALVEGVIADGDIAVIRGDREFFDGLRAIAGDRARCIVNADLDMRPSAYVGGDGRGGIQLSFPREPTRAPEAVEDTPPGDPRPVLIYAGETALNARSLCTLAPVVIEAQSPTLAHVLKLAGEPASGLTVQLLDGAAVSWRL